jgi:hypothetical protein
MKPRTEFSTLFFSSELNFSTTTTCTPGIKLGTQNDVDPLISTYPRISKNGIKTGTGKALAGGACGSARN